jgi:NADPH:quinone reductase-like Zn-dependent oxidoreductase
MSLQRYGGPDALGPVELPRPEPAAEQVLVRVAAAAVNPVDWKMASGTYRLILPVTFPWVPGFDVAGEVVALGPGVTAFAVGDRVHARLRKNEGGASAEYTVAGVGVTARMPAGMDFAQAAGLPLAGMTALQGLRDECGLSMTGSRARVLIVGASGGVGHLAVQLARAAGATVAGVCSGRNAELVASLGAHEVLDYTRPDPYRGQPPFDVILDCIGGSPSAWTPLLGPGGRFGSVVPGPSVFLRGWLNAVSSRKVRPVLLQPNAVDLQVLDALAAQGKLRVVVDSRFPLEALGAAWARSIEGRAVGKVVVDVTA